MKVPNPSKFMESLFVPTYKGVSVSGNVLERDELGQMQYTSSSNNTFFWTVEVSYTIT